MTHQNGLAARIRADAGAWRDSAPEQERAREPARPQMPDSVQLGDEERTLEAEARLHDEHPPKVAVLRVIDASRDDQRRYRMELQFRGKVRATNKVSEINRQLPPQGLRMRDVIASAEWKADQTKTVKDVLMRLVDWSDGVVVLNRWLAELRKETSDDLRLIVWDETSFEIPWELFRHRMDGRGQWLGVAVTLIRWISVHSADRPQRRGDYSGIDMAGRILCHEDPKLASGEQRLFEKFAPIAGYREMESVSSILDWLDTGQGADFIYVRCHGKSKGTRETTWLGDLPLAGLGGRDLLGLRNGNPLVFLNSCSSAQPIDAKDIGTTVPWSFAEIFLRGQARAVIATFADVETGLSNYLARALVRDAIAAKTPLPELLRRHREERAAAVPTAKLDFDTTDRDNIKNFLVASMFAYFEAPDAIDWEVPDA